MHRIWTLFKIELTLSFREFSGVLFGILMPVGIMFLLGALEGGKPAHPGAAFSLVQQSFPAVAAIGICATGLMGIPFAIATYREKKILKHFRVTPTSPFALLAAQFANNTVFAVTSSLLVLAVAVLFYGYTLRGPLLSFLGVYLLVLAALFSLGMMLASIAKNSKSAGMLCSFLYFPMLFLSGATIPFEVFPAGVRRVAEFLPLTQGIKLLKAVSLADGTVPLLAPVCILTGTALLGILVSVRTFRWE